LRGLAQDLPLGLELPDLGLELPVLVLQHGLGRYLAWPGRQPRRPAGPELGRGGAGAFAFGPYPVAQGLATDAQVVADALEGVLG
jgi:hypothetical protein